jgi:exodeoxyribonuclease-5
MSSDEMNRIYTQIMDETEGSLSAKLKAVQNDPYYNALQVKYAYCLTCHKAQGGQWRHVYIDIGALQPDALNIDFYRWLYTAVTRASEQLYLINPSIPVK